VVPVLKKYLNHRYPPAAKAAAEGLSGMEKK
jgi:hypothetical protein